MDVIIIGAGMIGLTQALALDQAGFSVALIDAKMPELTWDESLPAVRVSAINAASQQLLEQVGVWSVIAQTKGCHPYTGMNVWDANSTAHIEFTAQEIAADQLGHIVDNRQIIKALWQKMSHSKVMVLVPETIKTLSFSEGMWMVQLTSGKTVEGPLLIGADGANSSVRKQLSIGLKNQFSGQSAIVCTVKTENPHHNIAYQRFLESGPLAFLPLSNPHYCSIVWSNDSERAQHLASVSNTVFNAYVTEALQKTLGNVEVLGERAVFPLNRQQAETYIYPQAALIGDAAHSIHPLAGLGANLGFADVTALTEALTSAKAKGRPFYTPGVLARYAYDRQGENTLTLLTMEGFHQLFSTQKPALSYVRSAGMNGINRLGCVKSYFIEKARGC